MTNQSGSKRDGALMGAGVLLLLVITLLMVSQLFRAGPAAADDRIDGATLGTQYQAVLLNNGLAYFGHVEKENSRFLTLSDVYYIRAGVKQDTNAKAQQNVLVKRGSEWHEPDRMTINIADIVFIEPVKPTSTVGKLISESRAKGE